MTARSSPAGDNTEVPKKTQKRQGSGFGLAKSCTGPRISCVGPFHRFDKMPKRPLPRRATNKKLSNKGRGLGFRTLVACLEHTIILPRARYDASGMFSRCVLCPSLRPRGWPRSLCIPAVHAFGIDAWRSKSVFYEVDDQIIRTKCAPSMSRSRRSITFETRGVTGDRVRLPLLLMVTVYTITSPTIEVDPEPPEIGRAHV